MKKVSDTYKKLGIDFAFPIQIKDVNGNETYYENSDGGYWYKCEYDSKSNRTYFESSSGDKKGTPRGHACAGKVIEVDGRKYKLMEL